MFETRLVIVSARKAGQYKTEATKKMILHFIGRLME